MYVETLDSSCFLLDEMEFFGFNFYDIIKKKLWVG